MSLLLHPKLLPQEGTPRRAAPPAHAAPSPFLVPVRLRRVIPTRVSAPPRARSRSAPFPPSPSHQLGVHVRYDGTPESFDAHHPDLVAALDPDRLADVHADLAAELARRRDHFSRAERRRREVAARYRPLHPDVYVLLERHVDPRWRQLADMAREALAAAESASAKKPSARDRLLARARRRRVCSGSGLAASSRPRALARVLSRASRGGGAFRTEWIRTVAAEHHEHERTSPVRAGRVPSSARSPRRSSRRARRRGALRRRRDDVSRRGIARPPPLVHRLVRGGKRSGLGVPPRRQRGDPERVPRGRFEGGELLFGGVRDDPEERHLARTPVAHRPGMALLHRGSHCHEAVAVEAARGRISSCGVAVPRRGGGRVPRAAAPKSERERKLGRERAKEVERKRTRAGSNSRTGAGDTRDADAKRRSRGDCRIFFHP